MRISDWSSDVCSSDLAVIVLHDGHSPSDDLKHEIQEHVKSRLAAHEYPREVFFVQELPMTTTGKVIRRELRDSVGRWRHDASQRSEERRVGKEWVSTCRSRGSPCT